MGGYLQWVGLILFSLISKVYTFGVKIRIVREGYKDTG